MRSTGWTAALLGALVVGCAPATTTMTRSELYGPSAPRLSAAESAVAAARAAGAERHPTAAEHVRYAQRHLALARRRYAAGDYRSAVLLLRRAEAEAELGRALARRATAEEAAVIAEGQLHRARLERGGSP